MKTKDFLKKHRACAKGAKWALSMSDDMADVWEAMIAEEKHAWLIWTLSRAGVFPSSTLRKLACRFVRETPLLDDRKVWDLLTDERSRKAVEVAELYADGKATNEELKAASDAAAYAADAAAYAADAAYSAADAADAASHAARVARSAAYAADAASHAARVARSAAYAARVAHSAAYAARVAYSAADAARVAYSAADAADAASHAARVADAHAKAAQIKMIAGMGNPFVQERAGR